MRHLTIRLLSLCIVTLIYFFLPLISDATDYQYGISLDPPINRFFVRPEFDIVSTEFAVHNSGDPLYAQLRIAEQQDFAVSIFEITDGQYRAVTNGSVSLLSPKSSKQYRVEISRLSQTLQPKDYLIDLYFGLKPIQIPKDVNKPLVTEPKIHKYVILSITQDGSVNVDPKIALFRSIQGPITLVQRTQKLLLTLQNRSNYMFGTSGKLKIKGPQGFEQTVTIPTTYILANSQKNISIPQQSGYITLTLPQDNLHTGQYTASVELTILGSDTPQLYAQTTYWMVSPTIVLASVLFCLMIIIIIIFIGIRHV